MQGNGQEKELYLQAAQTVYPVIGDGYRSNRKPATAIAVASRARTIYLFAENHEREGSSPALRTRSRFCAGCVEVSLTEDVSTFWPGSADVVTVGDVTAVPLEPWSKEVPAEASAFAIEGAAAAETPPADFEARTGAAVELSLLSRACGLSWPRHFFSSHSTQSTLPAEMGNPQASHFLK